MLSYNIFDYSDPVRTAAEKLFDGPVQFIPIRSPPPTFRLSLRHVLAVDQIPDGTDPNSVEHFSVTYDESDFSDAVTLMIEKKRTRDATNLHVSSDKVEDAKEPKKKKQRDM
jgi:hypothetical protein